MEPSGNEEHYSETLYRLPDTGLNYEVPAAIHDGQLLYDKFDLPRDRPILNSLQSTFKYIPRNDWTYAEIAKRHPEAFIVLVGHMGNGGIADRLYERLRPHFEHRGLEIEHHLRILPASTTATSWACSPSATTPSTRSTGTRQQLDAVVLARLPGGHPAHRLHARAPHRGDARRAGAAGADR